MSKKDIIIKLLRENPTRRDTHKLAGCSSVSVHYWRNILKLPPVPRGGIKKPLDVVKMERMLQMRSFGKSLADIGKEFGVSRQRIHQMFNSERIRARSVVYILLKNGEMVKPDCCSECNEPGKLHAHHDDYSKPTEVKWLCPKCHRREHGNRFQHYRNALEIIASGADNPKEVAASALRFRWLTL